MYGLQSSTDHGLSEIIYRPQEMVGMVPVIFTFNQVPVILDSEIMFFIIMGLLHKKETGTIICEFL